MTDVITTVYDVPKDDFECWKKYPKHRWVYDSAKLLESQKINWCPFATIDKSHSMPSNLIGQRMFPIEHVDAVDVVKHGCIFVERPEGKRVFTDVIIQKGEVKWMKSHNGGFIEEVLGNVDLRIHAFIVLYFKKFNGCISVETIGNQIYACQLRPTSGMVELYPEVAKTLLKKIYNKRKNTVSTTSR